MKKVHISASREYDVLIERGLLDRAGEHIAGVVKGRRAVIVSGDNVYPLYGERLEKSLQGAGFQVSSHILPHGEGSKSLERYGELLSFLLEKRMSRRDVLVALGGGVTGDLTGFAAATYQRGMDFVQIPTSLLAAVDSSVGGKTAINLPRGKNQVGCFYQPALVLCDPETLKTLPEEEYRCGCAEVIKYGVLGSRSFFDTLLETQVIEQLEDVIFECVKMKRDIVNEDEFDTGRRQLLNLGHSFGHAVEVCSGFEMLHGQAVAVGMAMMCRAAAAFGRCDYETVQAVEDILRVYGLPVSVDYSAGELLSAVLSDKKLSGGSINLVVPAEIGRCEIVSTPVENIEAWLRAGGAA